MKLLYTLATAMLCCFGLTAQTSISPDLMRDAGITKFSVSPERQTLNFINFDEGRADLPTLDQTPALLGDLLQLRSGVDVLEAYQTTNPTDEIAVRRFQQSYKNIKVEHGHVVALAREGRVAGLHAEFYALDNIKTAPSLDEQTALALLLDHIGASEYAWESVNNLMSGYTPASEVMNTLTGLYQEYYPSGELVIVDDYNTTEVDMDLAYKFNIYAAEPLSRADYYVNAHTGAIMLADAIIKHATGDTRYAGLQSFGSTFDSGAGGQVLRNNNLGGGIETTHLDGRGGLPLSVAAIYNLSTPIVDTNGDSYFSAAEHRPVIWGPTDCAAYTPHVNQSSGCNEARNHDIAVDAHWGAEVVYNYWIDVHGRLSYDDKDAKINSFVHYGDAYDNAFWNGSAMTYGDGSYQGGTNPNGSFDPLTSMDVCAHEVGHAVCSHTSDLVYQRESGAMNEGFSDIWAAAVEQHVLTVIDGTLTFDPWGIGEQIDQRDGGIAEGQPGNRALRWMDTPQIAGDPDSYGGVNWTDPECGEPTLANDYCGVHSNSGVLNHWYYILTVGGGQPISVGAGSGNAPKPATDDGVSDAGFNYGSLAGIGFGKSQRIAYITETFLTPNSKFIDARAASLVAAGALYGVCGTDANATATAWDAVDVPADPTVPASTQNCTPRIEFINVATEMDETSADQGCAASTIYTINATTVGQSGTVSITATGSGANPAVAGKDFNLLTTSVNAGSNPNPQIEIEILDNAIVDGNRTFTVTVSGNQSTSQEFTILDNDVVPVPGSGVINMLPEETFDGSSMPAGWTVVSIGESSASWYVGNLSGKGTRAFASDNGSTDTYDQTAFANTILVSPRIDARGLNSVTLDFVYSILGEYTAPDYFDYGEVMYSFDKTNWESLDRYAVTAPGTGTGGNGTASISLPGDVNNTFFHVGFRWYNDELVGTTAGAFSIDNVVVEGKSVAIDFSAGNPDNGADENVGPNETAYFFDDGSGQYIGSLRSVSGGDFGCSRMELVTNTVQAVPFMGGTRTTRTFEVSSANQTDEYEVTIFFSSGAWSNISAGGNPRLTKTTAATWEEADASNTVFATNQSIDMNAGSSGEVSITGTFTGFSTFAVTAGAVVLPVELLDFTARPQEQHIELNWRTASEQNNDGFALERRAAGESTFRPIAWIAGNGSTETESAYAHPDREVVAGTTYYYRLRQIDFDGTETLSKIVTATLDGKGGTVLINPNPASTEATLTIGNYAGDPSVNVEVLDLNGRLVRRLRTTSNVLKLDLTGLSKGMYLIRSRGEGWTDTQRLIVE